MSFSQEEIARELAKLDFTKDFSNAAHRDSFKEVFRLSLEFLSSTQDLSIWEPDSSLKDFFSFLGSQKNGNTLGISLIPSLTCLSILKEANQFSKDDFSVNALAVSEENWKGKFFNIRSEILSDGEMVLSKSHITNGTIADRYFCVVKNGDQYPFVILSKSCLEGHLEPFVVPKFPHSSHAKVQNVKIRKTEYSLLPVTYRSVFRKVVEKEQVLYRCLGIEF